MNYVGFATAEKGKKKMQSTALNKPKLAHG